MTLSDIAAIAASVLAALGGGALIVLAFSGWLGKVWASRLMEADKAKYAKDLKGLEADLSRAAEDRTRKLENLKRHYERQIEEFYGPLFNMVQQIFVANEIKDEILKRTAAGDSEKVREYFDDNYFEQMHAAIRDIFKSKLYLVEGTQVPESFYQYLKHAAQEHDQMMLWKQHRIDTSFVSGEPWPELFDQDIRAGFEIAMRNYQQCLEGLKA